MKRHLAGSPEEHHARAEALRTKAQQRIAAADRAIAAGGDCDALLDDAALAVAFAQAAKEHSPAAAPLVSEALSAYGRAKKACLRATAIRPGGGSGGGRFAKVEIGGPRRERINPVAQDDPPPRRKPRKEAPRSKWEKVEINEPEISTPPRRRPEPHSRFSKVMIDGTLRRRARGRR